MSALICSGLDTTAFTFIGFLPKTAKKCRELLEKLKSHEETLIFYEAPHHLKATLKNLLEVFGNRDTVLARELTKIHEEFIRSNLEELIKKFDETEPRGEFVIVVNGSNIEDEKNIETSNTNLIEIYKEFINAGLDKKSAMRETAKRLNISRREVYQNILREEN